MNKKLIELIELIKNRLHIYSAKTYSYGSIVVCDYIKKVYYESGQLKYEVPYVHGKRDGISKGYYESGKLMAEIPYEKGEIHGTLKGYYESGQLAKEELYVYDKLVGTNNYDENGNIITKYIQ